MFYEDHIVTYEVDNFQMVLDSWSNWNIWTCIFLRWDENRRTRRKTIEARERTNKQLNSHMTPSPGIYIYILHLKNFLKSRFQMAQ
jgi:hypothetical protein